MPFKFEGLHCHCVPVICRKEDTAYVEAASSSFPGDWCGCKSSVKILEGKSWIGQGRPVLVKDDIEPPVDMYMESQSSVGSKSNPHTSI